MNTKTTLSTTDARKKLFQITKDVQMPGRYYTLTEKGKPKAVLMSAEEFESWQETMEVLAEDPNILNEIRQAEEDIKTGKYLTYPTFKDILEEDGFVISEKKGNYEIFDKVSAKGKKTARKASEKRQKKS